MAKLDFCFTYYDGDATREMAHMNRLERGAYTDVIIQLRQRRRLTIDDMKKFLSRDFEAVWPALEWILKKDEDGYFIEWLENSIQNATKHSKKQSKNVKNRYQKENDVYQNDDLVVPKNDLETPLGNGNGNEEEEIGGTGEKGEDFEPVPDSLVGEMTSVWKKHFVSSILLPDDTRAFLPLAKLIQTWKDIRGRPVDTGPKEQIIDVWNDVVFHCAKDVHFSGYSPSRILKYFSSITQTMTTNARTKSNQRNVAGKSAGASELLASLQNDLQAVRGAG